MDEIKRYGPTKLTKDGMHEFEYGKYVLWEDHVAIFEKLKDGIEELEDIVEKLKAEINLLKMQQDVMYQDGWIDGYNNGSNYD